MSFPTNFIWGAATSAYQIEGATYADGKGPSVGDVLTHSMCLLNNGNTPALPMTATVLFFNASAA